MAGPWEQYRAVPGGGFTVTTQRDPVVAHREQRADDANARAAEAAARAAAAADRTAMTETIRTGLQAQGQQNTQQNQHFTQAQSLAQDYNSDQTVKTYASALPSYGAALKTPATPQGDLSLIYAFAKIMDPNSVVRESESEAAANTQPIGEKYAQQFDKNFRGGGTLSDGARQKMREALASRMAEVNRAYLATRDNYKQKAVNAGADPFQVVGNHLGEKYQATEEKFLGHPIAQADFHGNVIATGDTRRENDPGASAQALTLIKAGFNDAQVNAALKKLGATPIDNLGAVRDFIKKNPNYQGLVEGAVRDVPTTLGERIAGSPVGTGVGTFFNSSTGGLPALLAGQEGRDKLKLASEQNFKSALTGNLAGGLASTFGIGKGLSALGLGAKAAGITSNLGYSTAMGVNNADEGERLQGGAIGLGAGALGEGVGRLVLSPALAAVGKSQFGQRVGNATRGLFGREAANAIPALSAPQRALAETGVPFPALRQMEEARALGLPFLPADASQGLMTLGGAAVRRSPAAKEAAEGVLLPRARGQIDRLTSAMDRDFGPGVNIPERSDELIRQARTQARPLYEDAMTRPGASNVDIADLQQRPSWQPAINNARRIAAEEGRDPTALGFDLNDQGETILTRVPSFDTLDLTKQGLDDIIEGYRDPTSGRVNLDRFGRAVNDTRANLLSRIDAANPAYAPARQAFAGPAGEREALGMGKQALSQTPDSINFALRDMPAPRQEQYRLGMREALGQRAENVRFSSNPYDAVAGSPAMNERLSILNPETAPRFTRQAQFEGQMARTNNSVMGNSMTAERGVADANFATDPTLNAVTDAALNAATGNPVAAGLSGARALGGDRFKGFLGARAERKAAALAPMIFGDEAAQSLLEAYQAARTRGLLGAQLQRSIDPVAARIASAPVYPFLASQ